MTTVEPAPSASAWSWWESRRLRYNIGLFIAGWAGFGLQAAALSLWSEGPVELAYLALWQGLIYVFYMAGANIAYLWVCSPRSSSSRDHWMPSEPMRGVSVFWPPSACR